MTGYPSQVLTMNNWLNGDSKVEHMNSGFCRDFIVLGVGTFRTVELLNRTVLSRTLRAYPTSGGLEVVLSDFPSSLGTEVFGRLCGFSPYLSFPRIQEGNNENVEIIVLPILL